MSIAMVTAVDATVMLLVAGVGFAAVGVLRGSRVDRTELGIQSAGFVAFSAIALAAMMVGPVLAAHLAAMAAIAYGVWDIVHHRRDKVVARSFTEFCVVLDLGLGAVLLIVTWASSLP